MILPLFFLQSVRDGEGQTGDDQQGHAVAGKVEALPGGPRRQQHTAGTGLELLRGMDSTAAHGEQRIAQAVVRQTLFHRRHSGVGREQRQGVALGRVQQGGDLLRQLVIVGRGFLPGRDLG